MPTNVSIGELFSIEKGLLQSTKCTPGEYDFITASSEWKTHNEFDHEGEYLIFAAAASGSLGRTHYVKGKFISSDLCYILEPKNPEKYPINMHFYHFVFNSLRSTLVADTKSGTSKEAINQKNFKKYKLPYFDIEQQDFWIDKLKNTLDIKNHFSDEAANQQDLLKKLRQQIIQDAIEGKLTEDWREQNPNVEPASELLKRIQAEKEQLIKDKKIKKQKALPAITDDTKPFELPDSWEWCRLGEVISSANNGIYKHVSFYNNDGVVSLRMYNIQDGEVNFTKARRVELSEEELNKYELLENDLLFNRVNSRELVGKTAIIRKNSEPLVYESMNMRLRLIDHLVSEYINKYLLASNARTYFFNVCKIASGQVSVNQDHVFNLLISFPPLQEQKEIVKKIKKLFVICDQLEKQITSSQANANQLIQSVLKEAFSQNSAA
jgi:type I restriction enzyme, S subunit